MNKTKQKPSVLKGIGQIEIKPDKIRTPTKAEVSNLLTEYSHDYRSIVKPYKKIRWWNFKKKILHSWVKGKNGELYKILKLLGQEKVVWKIHDSHSYKRTQIRRFIKSLDP